MYVCLLEGAGKFTKLLHAVDASVRICVIYSVRSYFDGDKCVEWSSVCYFRLLIGVLFWVFIDVLCSVSADLLF